LNVAFLNDGRKMDAIYPPISTARLTLRMFDPSRAADYEAVLGLYNAASTRAAVGDLGAHTRGDFDRMCENRRVRRVSSSGTDSDQHLPPIPSHPFLLIHLRDTDTLVGMVSLAHRRPLPAPDLGYAITEEHAGLGYATEAAAAALKFWTDTMKIPNVWVATFDTNVRSQRVARKLGLVDGGHMTFLHPDKTRADRRVVGAVFVQPHMRTWFDGLVVDLDEAERK
jgi:RimJ/RimL family protein N-acetyltransferase